MCQSLRFHLLHYLRRRLLDDGHATGTMRDQHLAGDLGLKRMACTRLLIILPKY
ncbi:hypothetical protein D3C77_718150 [compost metagenome]